MVSDTADELRAERARERGCYGCRGGNDPSCMYPNCAEGDDE